MWVPLEKKKTKQNMKGKKRETGMTEGGESERNDIFIFFLLFASFQIYENLTVGFSRDKHEKYSTRRGLGVGTKNKGFHREFR